LIVLEEKNLNYSNISIVDEIGRVFFYDGRVLRAIYSNYAAECCIEILNKKWITDIFHSGLIKTWICQDIKIPGVALILEHQKVPYQTHPSEHTSQMHWLAAKTMIKVNLELSKYGYILKDSHPWNIMFYKGYPYFIDFGSIMKSQEVFSDWLSEFRKYFGVPIWLSSTRWRRFSLEYRRQHSVGFGLELFDVDLLKTLLLRSLGRLQRYADKPTIFFRKLDRWLDNHKPINSNREYWADYLQSHNAQDPLLPKTTKQKFVYDILIQERPEKVLDCAANKGYYSEMAARLGSSVVAFDYEEYCVDTIMNIAQLKKLDITPVHMNVTLPTPNYGMGLIGSSAFERYQVDVVLAIGIAHHLCITQSIPVKIFCDICLKYAKRGVIFEYVDPSDKHVREWNASIPIEYTFEKFMKYFSSKFPKIKQSERITDDGICRTFVYFHL